MTTKAYIFKGGVVLELVIVNIYGQQQGRELRETGRGWEGNLAHPLEQRRKSGLFFPVLFWSVCLRGFLEHPAQTFYTDVTGGTTGVGSKGDVAIVANTAIFAGIERFHVEVLRMLFGGTFAHLESLVMAA